MTVEVRGADRLQLTLAETARLIERLRDPNGDAARRLAADTNPPRRTGRLASSIGWTADDEGATIGPSVIYGPPIEFGWPARNITPRRYLESVADRDDSTVAGIYRDFVYDEIRRIRGI